MKLSIKLPLLLLPITALSLTLVGYVCYSKLNQNAEDKTFKHATALQSQIISHLDSTIATACANASLFADYQTVRYFLLAADENARYDLMQRPLQKSLIDIQKAYPEYYEIRLILPDGFEDIRIVNRDIDNVTENEATRSSFRQLDVDKDINKHFAINPDNGELAYYLYKKIDLIDINTGDFSVKPKFYGYLSLTLDTSQLRKMLEENPIGTSGGIFLTDHYGNAIITPSHMEWANDKKLVAEFQAETVGHKRFHKLDLNGKSYYHTRDQVSNNILIHTLVSEDEILKASQSMGSVVLNTTVTMLLLSLTIILYLLRVQVLTPLKNLQLAFIRIGEGDELVQVPVTSNDEIGELNKHLNQMSLELKKSNDKILNMAFCDNLTQLPNRFMFHKNLKRAMKLALMDGTQLALFFIDLDNFKRINDTMGHQTGDELLREVAKRLASNLRGNDYIGRISTENETNHLARLGGDEFTLILQDLDSHKDVIPLAERIIESISLPYSFAGQDHYIGASIGIAVYPGDGDNTEDLIKHADLAMYQAKANGKGNYHFYSAEISNLAIQRNKLEQRLRKAIKDGAFELNYQPIVDCQNLNTRSLEALIRWKDNELGLVSPGIFIPIAEDTGLIHEIGAWVIDAACKQLKAWQDSGAKDISVAVNVSGKQLEKPEFFEQIRNSIRHSGIKAGTFYVELTESAIIQGKPEVLETLRKLRNMKVMVALDDFGTGYSSLSYLKNLPIDILKIDRSFCQQLEEKNNNILLSAIITMAQALNLKVIAEGIEEQEQFDFLKQSGCDMLQGYMFCQPQTIKECTKRLRDEKHITG